MATKLFQYDDFVFTESVESCAVGLPTRLDAMQVPKRHGVLISEVPVLDARRVSLSGKVQESDAETLRTTLDNMEKVFRRFNKKLRIWDDRYANAYCSSFSYSYIPGTVLASAGWSAEFLLADPFWYSDTPDESITIVTAADLVDVTNGGYLEQKILSNDGTVFVYPIITCAKSGSGNATRIAIKNLTTGRQIVYIGTLLNTQSLVIDCGQFTVKNNGVEDLTNFSGSFVWLDPGDNIFQFETNVPDVTFTVDWTKRYF